ncbi:MAG TPA: YciI family protein [Micromonosporaceae bacterium]
MSVRFQPTFLIRAEYCADAAQAREPYRDRHLEGVARLLASGTALVAGAMADLSASVLVVRADDAQAARALAESDVYWRNGVWTNIEVSEYMAATVADIDPVNE